MQKIFDKLNLSVHFKKYLFNTGWLFLEKFIRLFGNLVAGIFVARYLGDEMFGMLSFATSLVFIIFPLASLGLDPILVRSMVREGRKRDFLLGTAFFMKVLSAIGSIGILLVVLFLTNFEAEINYMVVIISLVVIFNTFMVIENFFQSRVESKYVVFSNIIALSTSTMLKLLFVVLKMPLIAFAVVFAIEAFLIASLMNYYYSKRGFSVFKWKFHAKIAGELLKSSWPIIFIGFLATLYMRIDQVMIKVLMENADVGHYAAAVKISESYYFIGLMINVSLFPAIIYGKELGTEIYMRRLQKLMDLLIWLAIMIAFPIALLANFIIILLYGQEFAPAGGVLAVHVWAGVFVFVSQLLYRYLVVEKKQVIGVFLTLAGAIVNIILNYILIARFGIYGAAFATLISFIVSNYIMLMFSTKTRPVLLLVTRSFNLPRIIREITTQKSDYFKG